MVLTRDVKCHGFYGENIGNDPILFDFIDNIKQKTTNKENTINEKENENKLDL